MVYGVYDEVNVVVAERKSRRKWMLMVLVACIIVALILWWIRPKALTVQLSTVTRQTLHNQVFATGQVKPVKRQVITVGQLAAPFDQFNVSVGDHVKQGQVLITLQNHAQSAALSAAKQAVQGAKQTLEQAQAQYNAASPVLQVQMYPAVANAKASLTQAQAQLAQAQSAYDATVITAQFGGTVLLENPGGIAPDGSAAALLELVGDQKQIVVDVSEVDAVRLHTGMDAHITSDAYPTQSWSSKIASIAAFATTTSSGSGQVEVDLQTPAHFPVPLGYQVNVNIVSTTHSEVPAVPYDALVQQGSTYAVYVYHEGRVKEQNVKLGITGNAVVEVTSGLKPGEQVVLNPPSGLTDGEAVNVRD